MIPALQGPVLVQHSHLQLLIMLRQFSKRRQKIHRHTLLRGSITFSLKEAALARWIGRLLPRMTRMIQATHLAIITAPAKVVYRVMIHGYQVPYFWGQIINIHLLQSNPKSSHSQYRVTSQPYNMIYRQRAYQTCSRCRRRCTIWGNRTAHWIRLGQQGIQNSR